MANGVFHRSAGTLAGVGWTYYAHKDLLEEGGLAAWLGAGIGGMAGGAAPDLIDPPLHPNHRSIGHSMTLVPLAMTQSVEVLSTWRENLIARARQARSEGKELLASFYFFLAAFLTGFPPGYISHLLADFTTPKRLPAFI